VRKSYSSIIASLLVSLFIYLFYRTEKTVVNEIVIRMISFDSYATMKKTIIRYLPLHDLVIYSLPEGLWVFCITLMSKPYYIGHQCRRMNCLVIPLLVCVGLEVGQFLQITNGRFDLMDIMVSVILWLIAIFSFNDKPDQQNILAPLNGRKMVCFATYGIVYLSHVMP
jgi:hypothetical protein